MGLSGTARRGQAQSARRGARRGQAQSDVNANQQTEFMPVCSLSFPLSP